MRPYFLVSPCQCRPPRHPSPQHLPPEGGLLARIHEGLIGARPVTDSSMHPRSTEARTRDQARRAGILMPWFTPWRGAPSLTITPKHAHLSSSPEVHVRSRRIPHHTKREGFVAP